MKSFGVFCANFLIGPVPSGLGQLRSTRYITLDRNEELSGSLPSELGLLSSMRGFGASSNSITGKSLKVKVLSSISINVCLNSQYTQDCKSRIPHKIRANSKRAGRAFVASLARPC